MYLIYLLRRDLRLADNAILHALQNHPRYTHALPLYIFSPSQIEVSGFVNQGAGGRSPYPEARSRIAKFWRCGPHRARFLAEGLWDLKLGLDDLGSGLVMRVGHMHEVVRDILEYEDKNFSNQIGGVWMAKDWASEETKEERDISAVIKMYSKGNIEWKVWDSEEMLIHDEDLPMKPVDIPDVFTSFRKRLEPLRENVRSPLLKPSSLPPLPPYVPPQHGSFTIPTSLDALINALQTPIAMDLDITFPTAAQSAHPFVGGESHAHSRIQHLLGSGAMSSYKETRNGLLGEDFSTKLSGYLSHGFITARQIHVQMAQFEDGSAPGGSSVEGCSGYSRGENKGTAAVRFELLWRDYMRLCMRKYGDSLFSLYGFRGQQTQGSRHEKGRGSHRQGKKLSVDSPPWKSLASAPEAFERFRNGTTGTGLIDASMRELYLTGYTSNRARQNCASFLTKWLGIDWRVGAEWYESMLVDYDVASNWGNWQYAAGVGNDPCGAGGGGRRFNPVKQGWDYDPRGEYVMTWVSEFKDVRVGDGDESTGCVEVLLAGWKVDEVLRRRAGQVGSVGGLMRKGLEDLKGLEWVEKPLIKVNYTHSSGEKKANWVRAA